MGLAEVLLDSDVIIAWLRGQDPFAELIPGFLQKGEVLTWTPVSVAEIFAGVRKGEEDAVENLFLVLNPDSLVRSVVKPQGRRVQEALDALGIHRRVGELPVSAKTSREAAAALGVSVAQIAKSLIFTSNGIPVLVIASGANRVDERKLETLAGGKIRKADPETVRQATGFSIGGVPPLGHPAPLPTFIDRDLLRHDVIYAAAGVAECVFPISPDELLKATGGSVADLKEEPL